METKVNDIDTMENISAEKVSKMESEISTMKSDMSSMSSKINEVEKKVSSTNAKVSTIETDVASTKSKVSTIETDVSSTKSKMSSMSSKINEVEKKVSTIESDVAVVKKSVEWKFVGMGIFVKYDDSYNPGSGLTLAKCIGVCTDKRSSDSTWNGVFFRPSDGYCYCMKNDVGHDPSHLKDWMHFKC